MASDPQQTKRFVILLDGECVPTDRLRRQIGDARVIAADGGMRNAEMLAVEPELWLGDFDSSDSRMQDAYQGVPQSSHPPRKAISDGELAISQAVELGARSLVLCGAFGGPRTDHALFHLLMAIRLARMHGLDIVLTSGREEARPLLTGQSATPDWPSGTVFSVLPFSRLSGLTITGAEWPLDAVEVEMGSTLTLSNVVADQLMVSLRSGTAAMMATLDV